MEKCLDIIFKLSNLEITRQKNPVSVAKKKYPRKFFFRNPHSSTEKPRFEANVDTDTLKAKEDSNPRPIFFQRKVDLEAVDEEAADFRVNPFPATKKNRFPLLCTDPRFFPDLIEKLF